MSDAALKAAQISDSRAALAGARDTLRGLAGELRGDGPLSRTALAETLDGVANDMEGRV